MPIKVTKSMKKLVDKQLLDRQDFDIFGKPAQAQSIDKEPSSKNNNSTEDIVRAGHHNHPRFHHDIFDLM
ncbi:hypothetical protein [Chamaesiphon polymorphus]|uniref:Uncharacterized protein n=1 Tax=Chamaesiphon polymorphus CCALA 037 TaxID=2107692 RepID=A0A2T1FG64_9CYAN|nr:hypothetical protein [Chamaesiphon polymorphus]PSB43951.1 hypothetical protein C7B77_25915 [Chamaesiphon polymorphus CCALA 037]